MKLFSNANQYTTFLTYIIVRSSSKKSSESEQSAEKSDYTNPGYRDEPKPRSYSESGDLGFRVVSFIKKLKLDLDRSVYIM